MRLPARGLFLFMLRPAAQLWEKGESGGAANAVWSPRRRRRLYPQNIRPYEENEESGGAVNASIFGLAKPKMLA